MVGKRTLSTSPHCTGNDTNATALQLKIIQRPSRKDYTHRETCRKHVRNAEMVMWNHVRIALGAWPDLDLGVGLVDDLLRHDSVHRHD